MSAGLELVYTDASLKELGYMRGAVTDLAIGAKENDFSVDMPRECVAAMDKGSWVYFDGTGWGGIVWGGSESSVKDRITFKATGRTWEGVLEDHCVFAGLGVHARLEGTMRECLSQLLAYCSLGDAFDVADCCVGETFAYDCDLYLDGYACVLKFLKRFGKKLVIDKPPGCKPSLSAAAVQVFGDVDGQNRCDYTIEWTTPYNAILAIGKGEDEERAFVMLFADEFRRISETQTFFGLEERLYIYEYSNADPEALYQAAWQKLEELQADAEGMRMTLPEDRSFDVGDIARITSPYSGKSATAEIVRKVVKVDARGRSSTTNELGAPILEGEAWTATLT